MSLRRHPLLIIALVTAAGPAFAGPLDLYMERLVLAGAGGRCGHLRGPVATAVQSGVAQARNAALLAGASDAQLRQAEARARGVAQGADCAAPALRAEAGRAASAWEAWRRQPRQEFPTGGQPWRADRYRAGGQVWRLVQAGGGGEAFGLSASGSHLQARIVARTNGRPLNGARLIFRNTQRAPAPWLPRDLNSQPTPSGRGSRFIMASGIGAAPQELLPQDQRADVGSYASATFTSAAISELARLDPRERFVVELSFRGGGTRRLVFRVGDLSSASAFVAQGTV
ncbi:hypothetical protein Q0812_02730 [Brevundimonas sp. 2R-24]|uniref:Uncharacterized protein n=1 Tax=Peiella sedimenti TaxID=3061083 RepID=A0ABT8SIE0_9CAUL|nr:hypothetical protein [Caulobacteraceae bacterium XZ-24]